MAVVEFHRVGCHHLHQLDPGGQLLPFLECGQFHCGLAVAADVDGDARLLSHEHLQAVDARLHSHLGTHVGEKVRK